MVPDHYAFTGNVQELTSWLEARGYRLVSIEHDRDGGWGVAIRRDQEGAKTRIIEWRGTGYFDDSSGVLTVQEYPPAGMLQIPESFDLTEHPITDGDAEPTSVPPTFALSIAAGWAYRAETAANWLHEFHNAPAARRPPGFDFARKACEGIRDNAVAMSATWVKIAEVAALLDAEPLLLEADRDNPDNG